MGDEHLPLGTFAVHGQFSGRPGRAPHGFAFGWLLLAAGYAIMDSIPATLWLARRDERWASRRWVTGHVCLNFAILCLFVDLLKDRLFP